MKKKYFNWGKAYRTLLPVLDYSVGAIDQFRDQPDFVLRELRTLSLGGGRQTGKTHWMIGEMVEHDDTIMICKDSHLRNECVTRYKNRYGNGGAVKARRKFFTANDLESMKPELLAKILKKTTRVFIDEARYNYKLGMVYKYLARYMAIDTAIIVQVST